jgi:hypothetical protein
VAGKGFGQNPEKSVIKFEQFLERTGQEIDLFVGTGYVRFVWSGIQFTEWLLVSWQVEELEEEIGEE